MADPTNRLAMFSAPVADPVNMLAQQQQLPAGHPSNMLMWIRDQIPQYQADDSSTMSGITSRLKRTGTAIPRAGLETMANWLRGTHDINAVRIGEDTIAPLGLGAFAGFAGKAMAPSRDVQIARQLTQAHPDEVTVGRMYQTPYSVGLTSPDGMRLQRGRGELQRAGEGGGTVVTRPDPEVYGVADNVNMRGPHAVLADNAKSSVPGTVVNAMAETAPQGIRAYHGSPYDFDKFDISKVGTGEGGTPEFGSGLYFAEKEAVARQYRDDISDMHEVPKGHMYEVNIRADPNKMIDMDIPLDRQPEGARKAILSTRETIARREAEKRGIHPELIDEYVKQYMDSEFSSETKLAIRDFDSPYRTNILSDAIKKHGVPGIRYYDGMSRQSGSGTRNYVIFDDSLVDINRKYARTDVASSPGLAANATQEDSPVLSILSKYGLY